MRRFYNAVVVPMVNLGLRWLSRVCMLAGVAVLLAVAVGWTR